MARNQKVVVLVLAVALNLAREYGAVQWPNKQSGIMFFFVSFSGYQCCQIFCGRLFAEVYAKNW